MSSAKTMSPIGSPFPLLDWFNYFTNWQNAFSPTINFGSNLQDAPVEEHVLDKVGSYGYQLNRILDALQVVVAEGRFTGKNKHDREVLQKFEDLADKADQASNEFKGNATEDSVHELIQGLRRLQHSDDELDHERFKALVRELQSAFPK